MEQKYKDIIHELLEICSDRALERLVSMIPDIGAVEWYYSYSMSCPVWYVTDYLHATDYVKVPAKLRGKVMHCLDMMTFQPTVLWSKYIYRHIKNASPSQIAA